MPLASFHIELSRTNELLARIAEALERAISLPPESRLGFHKRGPESLITYGDSTKLWAKEELYNLIHPQGLAPTAEQELLDRAMGELSDEIEGLDQDQS